MFENLSLTGYLAIGLFAAWLLWYLSYLYNALVVSPLRKVPGPLSYIIFGQYAMLYERYFMMGGHVPHVVRNAQHYKYGPVVRTSANGVSVADPDLATEILIKKDYPKSEAAALLFKPLNPDALVAIVDKTEHRRTRRFMSQRFSVQGIAKMEHLMQFVYKAFDRRLQRTLEKSDKARINIWDLLHCAGIDTIGETAFGQTFNSIESSHARVVELVEDTFKYISITSAFPPMRNFAFLPINKNQQKRMDEMVDICTKILKERRAKTGTDLERDDIVQLLVSGKFPDNDENLSDYLIVTNMLGMLTAGSDSTSGAMGYFFISIMRNPQWIPKIMAEIDAAPLGENGLITAQTVRDTMPIFQACMKETLRLYTGRDFQRVAPEDVELKGHLIPAGAEVNVSRYGLHRGPWWAEPDAFKPERFLGAGSEGAEEPGKAEELMKGAYAPFSLGVRDCIGKNFAWQEMRVVLSNLLRNYEFEDIPGQPTESGIYVNIMLKNNRYDVMVKKRATKN